MQVFLLQQAIEQIKDGILLQLNLEMKKAVGVIEDARAKSELQIKTFALDNAKIEAIKSQLSSIFGEYQFKVEEDQHSTLSTSRQLATEVIDRITSHPLVGFGRESTVEEQPLTAGTCPQLDRRNLVSKENEDVCKQSFSSLRHVRSKDSGNFSVTNESGAMNPKDHVDPIKESLFESIFKPHTSAKIEASKKLFEYEAEIEVPDVTDSKFNEFLENELDRIKKTFLEDGQMVPSTHVAEKVETKTVKENLGSDRSRDKFSKRAASIGHKKSVQRLGQSPSQKKGFGTLSYKEKFEDLYFRGKNKQGSKESTKQTSNQNKNSKAFQFKQAAHSDVQDEFRSASQTSKPLSKYARPHNTGPLTGFSPLFKAE